MVDLPPRNRLGARMIKEIIRQHQLGIGKEKIAANLKISKNTVRRYLRQSAQSGSLPSSAKSSDSSYVAPWADLIDWSFFHAATDRGEALAHLWEELVLPRSEPSLQSLPYVTFWREFKRRFPNMPLEFHKTHPPGERCEIDYKGDANGLGYTDRRTGQFVQCRLFGSILCFSQLFYAEATHNEKHEEMLEAVANGFQYFGGVPKTTAHDNARTYVNSAHRYDPDYNPEFFRFCEFFDTAPLAMRPRRPKDKNLIENILGVFWRWMRRRLRNQIFYSLADLNRFIREQLEVFNSRIQRKYGSSRRQKFEAGEKSVLKPLPQETYRLGNWKKAKLHPDCHIQIAYNFYSAPYQYRGEELDVRITKASIEIFRNLERIAVHAAFTPNMRGHYRTNHAHLPTAHQAMLETTPQSILDQAKDIGPQTFRLMDRLLNKSRHPLLYLRRAQGIIRLANRYSPRNLESAAGLFIEIGIENVRLKEIERVMANQHRAVKTSTELNVVKRNQNPNLRGQGAWRDDLKNQEIG